MLAGWKLSTATSARIDPPSMAVDSDPRAWGLVLSGWPKHDGQEQAGRAVHQPHRSRTQSARRLLLAKRAGQPLQTCGIQTV